MSLKKYDGLSAAQLKPKYGALVRNANYASHNSDIVKSLTALRGFVEGKGGWDAATAHSTDLESVRLHMSILSEVLEKADVLNDDDLEATDV